MTFTAEDFPNRFDHAEAQQRIYAMWEQRGYFNSDPDPGRKPFTIVIPPPNVTGALHLGHALNNTLQDILIRARRMQGFNALWMPGTDHAGIATQAVVEKRLREEEGKTRHDLGREKLVERIWQWKTEYEARILGQLKRLGASCDWRRTRFTLDEVCARAVRHTFFDLFRKGLIYRGKRLVNWDTFLQTAVSDDEVEQRTVKGQFWHFRYPVIDPKPGEPKFVTIATTRPETMLGDTAVAVHPDPAAALDKLERELSEKLAKAPAKEKAAIQAQLEDARRRRETVLPLLVKLRDMALDGRLVMLPLLEREIPLVADEWARPELGSGCVKITPAHDPNDYEVGRRCELPMINILNPDGTLNENAGPYKGLTIPKARKQVVADLEADGLLDAVEDREIELPHSDRSKTPIEPFLADQWFVKMDQLAQSAMDAVTDGRVKIFPPRYAKTYLDWLAEKRDWCISRQLWWGHQIPVWQVTLKADLYQSQLGSIRRSLERVQAEFSEALRAFADAAGIGDDIVARPSELSATIFHICAKSKAAEDELARFYRRHHRARTSTLFDEDPPLEPDLMQGDPRREPDRELWRLIAIMDEQDPHVLDTWFSSALWPHSTLGWPEKTPELAYYYPTSTLITSRDIITLWVARMVLTGLNNMGDVPFREVFIHPKILDGEGETMSKSKGNGIDPLDIIDKFGADALRYGMAYLTTETQDVRMPVQFECPHCAALIDQTRKNRELPAITCSKCGKPFATQWARSDEDLALPRGLVVSERFELGRNFCNKLWNAARFALINMPQFEPGPVAEDELAVEDRWVLSRLATVTQEVSEALEGYHYSDAARSLYDFAWDEFCSFYVEMVKQRLQDESSRVVAERVLSHTLDVLLRLLHPITPFITEDIWQLLAKAAPQRGLPKPQPVAASVMIAPWPKADLSRRNADIEEQFELFQKALGAVREIRATHNIAQKNKLEFSVRCAPHTGELLRPMEPYFASMANAHAVGWGENVEPPKINATISLPGMDIFVDLKDFIDVEAECERLRKQEAKISGLIQAKQKKLSNAAFVDKAPPEVVARERESLEELQQQIGTIRTALAEMRG